MSAIPVKPRQANPAHLPCPLSEILEQLPPTLGAGEVYSHLENMPAHYWEELTKQDLIFHLSTIHEFFIHLAQGDQHATVPVIRSRHFPKKGHTELAVCTWDRKGLVSKIAGALACANLNILKASVYTRFDHVVLDLFRVEDPKGRHAPGKLHMRKVEAYLSQALESEAPLDLCELLDKTIHARRREKSAKAKKNNAPEIRVGWLNHHTASTTCLSVDAPDTPGLLHAILDELTRARLNVHTATIRTKGKKAEDEFRVTDQYGRMLAIAEERKQIALAVENRIRALFE
ncbi:ACT domain-containing protein [Oscillatoria amoena NRMC-F 0135]|nr:ACT domain-containing protein [Oscillatoria laete-virens]MDL5051056.1 ACT domain-containing protein [Oscillatoria amoena NRMC-F 0135]MDL5054503.1 ACT domain-containing protein [Oscillatoria laete-virens NRMC-F 0139]